MRLLAFISGDGSWAGQSRRPLPSTKHVRCSCLCRGNLDLLTATVFNEVSMSAGTRPLTLREDGTVGKHANIYYVGLQRFAIHYPLWVLLQRTPSSSANHRQISTTSTAHPAPLPLSFPPPQSYSATACGERLADRKTAPKRLESRHTIGHRKLLPSLSRHAY